MHCILQTEDKRDSDRTEEMAVCSLLGGYQGSSDRPAGVTLGAAGVTGITTTTAVYWESVAFKLRQTTANPATDGAAAACCEGLNPRTRARARPRLVVPEATFSPPQKMCFCPNGQVGVFLFLTI